jgi:hypothetical protein
VPPFTGGPGPEGTPHLHVSREPRIEDNRSVRGGGQS